MTTSFYHTTSHSKKGKSLIFLHHHFLLLFLIGTIFFALLCNSTDSSAHKKKIKWKSQPSTLQVGKSFRYRISGKAAKSKVRFHSNHPKRAKINTRTGKLQAKRQGSVIITAKVTKKNKSAKLKTKLRIIPSSRQKEQNSLGDNTLHEDSSDSYLKNVQFSASDNINPWDHSLLLYSNRILLQKEVEDTSLQLSPSSTKQSAKETYTASFSSLSPDGKCIRYQLSKTDAKKMCPGNGTGDTIYSIRSSFFSKQLSIKYQERIHTNSISGYVLSKKGKYLAGAQIQLISESSDTIIDTARSDKNGFYQFTDISDPSVSIYAAMADFDSLHVKQLSPHGHALCQNLILHPANSDELALSCRLVNSSGETIPSAAVILTDTKTQASLWGKVDQTGCITFTSSDDCNPADYSYIKYQNQLTSPIYQNEPLPVAERFTHDPAFLLNRNTTYQLQILPSPDSSLVKDYVPLSFCFSFADLVSDQILFHVTLEELPVLSTKTMSINTDTLTTRAEHYNYALYSFDGDLIFQTILSAQNDLGLTKELQQILLDSSLRLPDGAYFVSLSAFDAHQTQISATEIQKVSITDGKLAALTCHLSPVSSLQTFLYAKIPKEKIPDSISFTLYQEFSSIYFPVNTYTADNFSMLNYNSCQSILTLSSVKADTNYFLLPDTATYCISSDLTIAENNLLQNIRKDILPRGILFRAQTPSFQIVLTENPSEQISTKPELNINVKHDTFSCHIQTISLDRHYFDSSNAYPNTVYAYHQKDGSLLNISFQSSTNISSANPSFIMNCFKNGTDIVTNQSSYRLTPFFVT